MLFFTSSLLAMTVNRLNGGGNIIYIDFSLPGKIVPLELVRSYNSITATSESNGWLGAFGWGWTSPFETTLTTTPERNVILRDGGTGNTIFFHPQKADPRAKQAFFDKLKRAFFERKYNRKMSGGELAKLQLPSDMMARLKTESTYRLAMADKYHIPGEVPQDELLVSSEYGYQTIRFRENQWIREKDGVTQFFDKDGRLVRQKDKNGFYFNYKYSPTQRSQLIEISDEDRSMSLKFGWRQDRVVEVVDNRGHKAKYRYDANANLVSVTDSNNQTYAFRYENKKFPHLLTYVDYVSETTPKARVYRELRYDDNGLIVYHRDKDGTEARYTYGKGTSDPENDFWTKTSLKSPSGATAEEFDEYFIRARTDGSRYLYKQLTRRAGVETTTVFTSCCGKPQQIVQNGEVTNFKYYENGLLAEKTGPKESIRLEYDPRWNKVTKVNQNGVVSTYQYDEHGNLVQASNNHKQAVALHYDTLGRIRRMTDPEGKQITFDYNDKGKPSLISEKGVGTIRIDYDPDGKIVRTETVMKKGKGRMPSQAQSQEVIRRVMSGFQNLLDIIRPAGLSLVSG